MVLWSILLRNYKQFGEIMTNRYLATFISGTQCIIEKILRERLNNLKINCIMDGAVDFETDITYDSLNFFCFNNIFLVLDHIQSDDHSTAINLLICDILFKKRIDIALLKHGSKIKTFRIVASRENQLIPVDSSLKEKLEKFIHIHSGLSVKKDTSDTEFWLYSRNEGHCYFLRRLSKHTSYDKMLHKGELHPELAYMMCKLSNPKFSDVVLDPFCGYGSIPTQRSKRFPFTRIYAFDIKEEAVIATRNKYGNRLPRGLTVKKLDIAHINRELDPESIDTIITDPPWGIYEEFKISIVEFYNNFMTSFSSLLKIGGYLVILTAKKDEFNQLLYGFPEFKLIDIYHILVSGKKSAIYVIKKIGNSRNSR